MVIQLIDNNSWFNSDIIDCGKTNIIKKLNNNNNNYKQEPINGKSTTIKKGNRKYTNTNNTNKQFDVIKGSFTHIGMHGLSQPNKYNISPTKPCNYNNKGSMHIMQSICPVYESKPRKILLDSFSKPKLK